MRHARQQLTAFLAAIAIATSLGVSTATAQTMSTGEAPGGVGPFTWTIEPVVVPVVNGPDDEFTVDISVNLYVPDGASSTNQMPSLLTTHGFGNSKESNEQLANSAYFASHGYVVASYDSQGFGDSTGCIGLNNLVHDVKSARAVIDMLAGRPEVAQEAPNDPRVGMVGGSYGGGQQGVVAATDPRLDALAVGRTWNRLGYSLVPNNWVVDTSDPWDLTQIVQGVFKQEWTTALFGFGTAQPALGNGGCDPITQQTLFPGAVPCSGFIPQVCEIFLGLTATGDSNADMRALTDTSSVSSFIDDVTAPTLLLQGQPDTIFNTIDATATYRGLRDRGVPAAMIWHSSGHGGYLPRPGDGEAYNGVFDDSPESQAEFSTAYLPRRTLAWFDRWVRGDVTVDVGPPFAYFRDWVDYDPATNGGSASEAYGVAADFPVPGIEVLTLALDPSGLVSPESATTGALQVLNPAGGVPAAYSETSNFQAPGQPFANVAPTEIDGQHVSFDTPPFVDDTVLVGMPEVTTTVSSVLGLDARFFAKLYDVAPDGSTTLIRRMVAPVRIPASVVGTEVTFRLVGLAHQFEAGHLARLVLATTDAAYYNSRVADVITFATGPATRFTLPVLPLSAPKPAPEPEPTPEPSPAPLPATGGGLAALAMLATGVAMAGRRR